MNGLEISRGYYETYGKPMLEKDFPELLPYIAVGFTGSGSEHYGFDDVISRDHDFEPGFLIFLPDEAVVDRRQAFLLERAYAKLPKEFAGVRRQGIAPVGGQRNGVVRTAAFYRSKVGSADGTLTADGWLYLPDYALSEAVNGEIFYDGYGEVTKIRAGLRAMPRDILLKRLAGNVLIMGQAGQYNFERCLRHGEPEAAAFAAAEFVRAALKCAFLLNGQYMPYYKWSFRALRAIPGTEALADRLSLILTGDISDRRVQAEKKTAIEAAAVMISALAERGASDRKPSENGTASKTDMPPQESSGGVMSSPDTDGCDLERLAYALNDRIADSRIRNLHILAAVPDA